MPLSPRPPLIMRSLSYAKSPFVLNECDVHLWLLSKSTLISRLRHYYDHLTEEEKVLAMSFTQNVDREDFVLRHGVATELLQAYTTDKSVKIYYSDMHKPFLKNSNLFFNFSSSEDYFLFGFTQNQPIGVDVEVIRPLFLYRQLVENCLSEEELENFSACPMPRHFFQLWNCKEAILKAVGTGLLYMPDRLNCAAALQGKKWTRIHIPFLSQTFLVSAHHYQDVSFAVAVRDS